MGIHNQPESAATSASTPSFETEDQSMNEVTSAPTADPITNTAVANVANTAVSAAPARKAIEVAFADKQWAIDLHSVAALSQSAPRIKGEQGAAYIGNDKLGEKFIFRVESWNDRKLISAGLTPKDPGYQESIEYLRTSYDGQTIHNGDGQTVQEYIAFLKSLGYDNTKASDYTDIWGFVTQIDGKEVAPGAWTLHLLQASQTSQGAFKGFCATQGLLKRNGIIPELPEEVEVHAMARSKGSNKYTNFAFNTAPVKV